MLELTTYWSSVSHYNHYKKESPVNGQRTKGFISLQSYMTDSSWIYVIKLIQYKTGKTRIQLPLTD